MAHKPMDVWKRMKMKLWPERYWLIDLPAGHDALAGQLLAETTGRYGCVIKDQMGFSIVVDAETWERLGQGVTPRQQFGPLRVFSTNSELPFDVTGFIKAALEPVNSLGFKAAPQCGAAADHFFTPEDQIDRVVAEFEKFTAGFDQ